MVDPWVRRACWLAAWVAAGGCGPKAKVEGPVDGLAFSGDGSVVIAGSRRSGAIAVDTKGRARPIAVTDVARWTLSTDGAVAIGAAAEGFVVVDVASGSVTPVPVGERDGEPHQMFRTPAGDIAITKLVHSWRVHRWTPDQPTDPSPLILDQLRGAWVDRRGEVFFLDTGYGLQIREVATGRLLRTVDRRSDPQRYVDAALDADGRVVTALWDGDGFRVWAPPDKPGSLWNLAEDAPIDLGADGGLAAVGTPEGVELRSSTGKVLELVATKSPVLQVALSNDGRTVVGGLADGSVIVRGVDLVPTPVSDRPASDVDAGRIDLSRAPRGGSSTPAAHTHLLPDTPRLLRWAPAGKLQGWMGSELSQIDPFTGEIQGLTIKGLANGREFAWKTDLSTLAVMEPSGLALYSPGRRAFLLLTRLATGGDHSHLGWGGEHLVVDVDETKVQAWSSATGEPLGEPFQVAARVISGFSVSPDGSRLVTIGDDPGVYDIEGRKRVGSLAGHLGAVSGIDWSADGQRLASVGNDGTVILWNTSDWSPVRLFEGLVGQTVAFSPDGGRLVVAGGDRARVVDLTSGAETLSVAFQGTLTSVDWGELGLVMTTNANMVYIWP